MAVESAAQQEATRTAARATVTAVMAGMKAIRPGVSQRSAELIVDKGRSGSADAGVPYTAEEIESAMAAKTLRNFRKIKDKGRTDKLARPFLD